MFKKPFKVKSLSIKLPKKKDDKKSYKKIFLYGAFSLFSLSFISFCIYVGMVISSAPELDEIRNFTFAESTVIYDKTGEYKLFSVYGEENRRIVNIDQISPNFINAILAAEDDEFFAHPGFDLGGIAMAVCHEASSKAGLGNLGGLCPQRGGSTLTQQLVKNVLLSSEKAYSRKIKEWYLSWKIEQKMKKNEILELYANNVSFGSMNGIETASQVFFGKHAKDLTIAESAVLAAIPQRPTYFSPYGNHAFTEITVSEDEIQQKGYKTYEDIENLPGITIVIGLKGKDIFLADGEKDYFPGRADWILKRMNDLGFIKEVEYKEASEELKSLEFKQARNNIQAPHFVMYTKEILEDKFGKELIEKGGLKVVTTLDYGLQKEAERIIIEKAKSNEERFSATNSSLVSIAPETGHILAMVGSRDFFEEETNDGKVNVMLQRRLPGSSFKPIVYAAAFDKGLSPATVLFDTKTDFGSDWVPKNYDGKFSGPVQIRKALGTSLNIPAVKACIITGSEKVVELANKMGINLLNDAEFYGNAISLGAGEARGIDMTQAFSIFANNGKKVNLTPILKVYDRNGNLLMDNTIPPEEKEQILNEQTAYLITDILSDSEARGEGWNMHLQLSDRKNAVKTGTSNKKIKNITWPLDAWVIGYTPDVLTTVWSGNNNGSVMNHQASGFNTSGPIWKEFMEFAHKKVEARGFVQPEGIKIVPVSRFSGKLPLPDTDEKLIIREKFKSEFVPTEIDGALRIIEIDKVSNKLPTDHTPIEAIEKKAVLNFHSYYPENEDWERPVQEWINENGREFVVKFGVESFISSAPTEKDDIHTKEKADQRPEIIIENPRNYGIITPPSIDVVPNIKAINGIQKVEFYFDNELVDEVYRYPYKSTIKVSPSLKKGSTHLIKAIAVDKLYYSSASSIEVKIGKDDTPPNLSIVYPKEGDTVERGSVISIKADAFDERGSIKRVDFYINGQRIGAKTEAPFYTNHKIGNDSRYTLKIEAVDNQGNMSEKKVTFKTRSTINRNNFSFLAPTNNQKVVKNENVTIKIQVSDEMKKDFEGLDIYLTKDNGKKVILADFTESDIGDSGIFSASFNQGEYSSEIFAKVHYAGKSFNSEKISVFTQN